MVKNILKDMFKQGKPALGTWITVGNQDITEVAATVGFDYLVFDTEHAPLTNETVQRLMQVTGNKIVPLVRVAWNDQVLIKLALDIGAYGLIIPLVNSKEDAIKAVSSAKYPPIGTRGIGPRRASNYYQAFSDYVKSADTEVMVIIQIEHVDAVKNLDEILSVKGIDAIFIGPADLTASMGLLGKYDDPRVIAIINEILEKAKQSKVIAGIHTFGPEDAAKRIKQGFQLIIVGTDVGFFIQGCKETVNRIKELTEH
jgi:2-keto-3-deoxy-L-rhamnonate aldolase RhmA